MTRLTAAFAGQSLMARVLRSASWMLIGQGGSHALRLISNLLLTRLLFPEAFGLMALVSMVIIGLALFSDVGIGPSIQQNERGDDPDFLNTAWTIQVVRGFILWGGTLAMAWPVAQFYGEPDLALYLPLAGVSLVIAGFNPTRIETANRHLLVGRLTVLDLISQILGIVAMVVLALTFKSVMALVMGGVVQALVKLALCHFYLPGPANRFRWERKAGKELIRFGKWIFLSTAFYFATSQGDRAILGKFVSLETLGLYNIGFFLASFPSLLGAAITQRLLIPVYREKPAGQAPENARKLRLLRAGMTTTILSMVLAIALTGPWLVGFLYDDRYLLSGPMTVVISISLIPSVIGLTYDQAALAAGDSRTFFVFTATRAILQTGLFVLGVMQFGLIGGIGAVGLSMLLAYPVLIWLARKHQSWDPLHDLLFGMIGAGGALLALWLHMDQITALLTDLS